MKKSIVTILYISLICILITGCSLINRLDNAQSSNTPLSPTNHPTISPAQPLPEESLLIESYQSVLQNKIKFYSTNTKESLYLDNFLSDGGSGYEVELGTSHFTIIDMDGDNVSDVVLDLSFYARDGSDLYLVLHYMNETVYGYTIPYRGLQQLKNDSSFMYSSGASDWGYATLKFTSDDYNYNRLGYCESDDDGILYFIDNILSSEEEFINFVQEQEEKTKAVWYEFTQENIEAILSIDGKGLN